MHAKRRAWLRLVIPCNNNAVDVYGMQYNGDEEISALMGDPTVLASRHNRSPARSVAPPVVIIASLSRHTNIYHRRWTDAGAECHTAAADTDVTMPPPPSTNSDMPRIISSRLLSLFLSIRSPDGARCKALIVSSNMCPCLNLVQVGKSRCIKNTHTYYRPLNCEDKAIGSDRISRQSTGRFLSTLYFLNRLTFQGVSVMYDASSPEIKIESKIRGRRSRVRDKPSVA